MKVGERRSWQLIVIRFLLRFVRIFIGKRLPTVARMRKDMDRAARWFLPRAKNVTVQKLSIAGLKAERITPNVARHDKALYYLHGGAYALCSIETHRRMIAKIAEAAGITAFAFEYRMAPEHIYPAAVEDAVAGYQYLLAEGYKPEDIIIGGDSAGGGLSAVTLLKLKELNLPLPAGAVLLSPWGDLEGAGESNKIPRRRDSVLTNEALVWHGKLYAGTADLHNPFISPIYGDYTGLPPIMIQVGAVELIHSDSVRIAAKAEAAGVKVELVEWGHTFHVWQMYDLILPEARESIQQMGTFMKKQLGI
jgi:epsilon-lactone hydrolase